VDRKPAQSKDGSRRGSREGAGFRIAGGIGSQGWKAEPGKVPGACKLQLKTFARLERVW